MPTPIPILALFDVGGGEMLLIFFAVLMLFGGKRMPELARGLGKSLREFKKVTSGVEDQIKQAIEDAPSPPTPSAPNTSPPRALSPVPGASPVAPAGGPPASEPLPAILLDQQSLPPAPSNATDPKV